MTADEFNRWLAEMQAAGLIRSGHGHLQDAAALLGVNRESISLMTKRGTRQVQTDLACAAILKGLTPYSS